ncbi:uncharacterized protein A4U43_C10F1930 [Asparagus officinalis]|uniref:Uncharacterized protein n=1 Tax=Asparagus officinalis TaxID=4686 RepID=A0A5P1E012_ASPOF|nr:uncharacterized protein A4U43_C10F1930 [Asparagus officinalis]
MRGGVRVMEPAGERRRRGGSGEVEGEFVVGEGRLEPLFQQEEEEEVTIDSKIEEEENQEDVINGSETKEDEINFDDNDDDDEPLKDPPFDVE